MNMITTATMKAPPQDSIDQKLDEFAASLDDRIQHLLGDIMETECWKVLTSPNSDPEFVKLIMREVYLEIYSYQPQVIEATIAVISRMPKKDPKMMLKMLVHQAEEADHGEMALRDYVALGGDEKYARNRRMSPASFAVASLWWGLWRMEDPFSYLGALYPFEGLTPIVCQKVRGCLSAQGYPERAMEFIGFHAQEDIRHANLVRKLLKYAVKTYPQAAESISTGIEYFLQVYPIPVWNTAYLRARVMHNNTSSKAGRR